MLDREFEIDLNETQLLSLINAADFQSRIESGQLEDILFKGIPHSKKVDRDKIRDLLSQLKSEMFPELDSNESYGVGLNNSSENSNILYDLHQVMRYTYSWSLKPDGVIGDKWFDTPFKYSKEKLAIVMETNREQY